jgi:hypothetical protein
MVKNRFGQFLISKGIVDEATILKALDFQRQHTFTIGQTALKQHKLTVRQVLTILNTQIVAPKPFGEIAVELGYLTEQELSDLLELQSQNKPFLGEILVDMGKITEEQLNSLLAEFHRKMTEI